MFVVARNCYSLFSLSKTGGRAVGGFAVRFFKLVSTCCDECVCGWASGASRLVKFRDHSCTLDVNCLVVQATVVSSWSSGGTTSFSMTGCESSYRC